MVTRFYGESKVNILENSTNDVGHILINKESERVNVTMDQGSTGKNDLRTESALDLPNTLSFFLEKFY